MRTQLGYQNYIATYHRRNFFSLEQWFPKCGSQLAAPENLLELNQTLRSREMLLANGQRWRA